MLSRTAENLYWLARYVERAEYIARTIDATLRVTALPAAYIGKTNEWESALLTAGVSASFYETYQEATEQSVVEIPLGLELDKCIGSRLLCKSKLHSELIQFNLRLRHGCLSGYRVKMTSRYEQKGKPESSWN